VDWRAESARHWFATRRARNDRTGSTTSDDRRRIDPLPRTSARQSRSAGRAVPAVRRETTYQSGYRAVDAHLQLVGAARRTLQHPADRTEGAERGRFERLAEHGSFLASSPLFFGLCLVVLVVWLVGLFAGASNRFETTATGLISAVTLVLVALLKNAELRAERAIPAQARRHRQLVAAGQARRQRRL
jgi:hypothetical protein